MHKFLSHVEVLRATLLTVYLIGFAPFITKGIEAAEQPDSPDKPPNAPDQSSQNPVPTTTSSPKPESITDIYFLNATSPSPKASIIDSRSALIANQTVEAASSIPGGNQELTNDPLLNGSLTPLSEDESSDPMAQTTSVSQLSDVQPTDWAYEALKSLVERYGIISGYPDGTFRGNRTLSRYEFAAALNIALTKFDALIAANTADAVTKEDLTTLQKLQAEFTTELTSLRGRVDALEARTQELEATQFSTTTQLKGEAMLALADVFGKDIEAAPVFHEQVRLVFNTSFTGKDVLITGLLAGNATPFELTADTAEGFLAHQVLGDTGNDLITFALAYVFPIGDQLQVAIAAEGGRFDFFIPPLNPYLNDFDGGEGSLSAFAQMNPIYRLGGRVGAGVNYKISDSLLLSGAYLTGEGFSAESGDGLFNGDYAALSQLTWTPSKQFSLALTYINSYHGVGNFSYGFGLPAVSFTGTNVANTLNGLRDNFPVSANSYGLETSWKISPKFILSGWVGLTEARLLGYGDAEIWNYAVNLVFPDLGKKGSVGGLVFGAAPTLRGLQIPGPESFQRDWAYHVEAFYKYQATDNISITPGLIWLPSPNQNQDNSDIFLGVVRTTFTF